MDVKAQAETAQVLERIGDSQETFLTDLGYDAKTEREKKVGEAA